MTQSRELQCCEAGPRARVATGVAGKGDMCSYMRTFSHVSGGRAWLADPRPPASHSGSEEPTLSYVTVSPLHPERTVLGGRTALSGIAAASRSVRDAPPWHHGAFSRASPGTFLVSDDFLGGHQAVPSPHFHVPVRHPLENITAEATHLGPPPSSCPLFGRGLHLGINPLPPCAWIKGLSGPMYLSSCSGEDPESG